MKKYSKKHIKHLLSKSDKEIKRRKKVNARINRRRIQRKSYKINSTFIKAAKERKKDEYVERLFATNQKAK